MKGLIVKLLKLQLPFFASKKAERKRYTEMKEEVYGNEIYREDTPQVLLVTYTKKTGEVYTQEIPLDQLHIYEIVQYGRYKELVERYREEIKSSREPITEIRKHNLVELLIEITGSYVTEVTKEEILKNIMEKSKMIYYNSTVSKIIGEDITIQNIQVIEKSTSYTKLTDNTLYELVEAMLNLNNVQ